MQESAVVPQVGEGHREALRVVSPLALDLQLICGPVRVPAAVATVDADAETQDLPSSRALRAFFDDNPWEGMGSVTRTGWLLVAEDGDTLVFAQRRGPVGLGRVLTLQREDGGWAPVGLSGARLALPDPDERVEHVVSATARRATVLLSWIGDGDPYGRLRRRTRRVEVLETASTVHALVVTAPDASLPPATGWTGGVGLTMHATITLRDALGRRPLLDDSGLPPHRVLRGG